MAEYIERERTITDVCHTLELYRSEYEELESTIREIPAADVAPVRHGRWDKNGRCTVCGGHAPFWCMASTYYESPYCFECGAQMDLGGDDNG